jgi:hypothetical protein
MGVVFGPLIDGKNCVNDFIMVEMDLMRGFIVGLYVVKWSQRQFKTFGGFSFERVMLLRGS